MANAWGGKNEKYGTNAPGECLVGPRVHRESRVCVYNVGVSDIVLVFLSAYLYVPLMLQGIAGGLLATHLIICAR